VKTRSGQGVFEIRKWTPSEGRDPPRAIGEDARILDAPADSNKEWRRFGRNKLLVAAALLAVRRAGECPQM